MFLVNLLFIFCIVWFTTSSAASSTAVGAGCTITDFSQVSNVVNSCNNIVVKSFTVPGGQALHMQLKKGTTVTFQGTVTFGDAHWDGPLVKIEGEDAKIHGEAGAKFDGQGAKYWDGKGGEGSKKPLFFYFSGSGELNKINLLNCPERCSDVRGSFITLNDWNIDVSAAHKNGLGRNTDGIGVSGHDITVKNTVVINQDDCVIIGSGKNIHVSNVHCTGSHGLSITAGITSSFDRNTLSNITFKDCTVVDAEIAIHVKTVQGGKAGIMKDISYSNITMKGVNKFGIHVQQDYPNNDGKTTNIVPITGLTIRDVKGSMSGKNSVSVRIACASGACSDFNWSGIDIKGNHKPCSINYRPNGFNC